jgi:hypothetical protein
MTDSNTNSFSTHSITNVPSVIRSTSLNQSQHPSPQRTGVSQNQSSTSGHVPHSTPSSIPPFPFLTSSSTTAAATSNVAIPAQQPVSNTTTVPPLSATAFSAPSSSIAYTSLFSPPTLPPALSTGTTSSLLGGTLSLDPGGTSGGGHNAILTSSAVLSTNLAALATLTLSSLSTSELLFKSRLALQAERFDELLLYIRALIASKGSPSIAQLSMEERGLFSLAFKKLLASKRASWRFLYSIEMKERGTRKKIETEIQREMEREQAKQAQAQAQAAAAAAAHAAAAAQAKLHAEQQQQQHDSVGSSGSHNLKPSGSPMAASGPGASASTIVPVSVPVPSTLLPLLHQRLSQSSLHVSHIHTARYQVFFEAAALVAEVTGPLLVDKLIPALLPGQNTHVFGRSIPAIVELCVSMELKRTGRANANQAAVAAAALAAATQAQQQNSAEGTPAASIAPLLAAPGSTLLTRGDSLSSTTSGSTSVGVLPSTPALASLVPVSTAAVGGRQQHAHWSIESEMELQLRALDAQTKFVSGLRGGAAAMAAAAAAAAAGQSTPTGAAGIGSNNAASSTSINASNSASSSASSTSNQPQQSSPASPAESLVFYVKMLADYRRLLAEFLSEREYESTERQRQSLLALCYYSIGRFIATQLLAASSPVRLGLTYNHSVFLHEVMAQPDRAAQLAKNAYDMAYAEHKAAHLMANINSNTTNSSNTGGSNVSASINTTGAGVNGVVSATTAGAGGNPSVTGTSVSTSTSSSDKPGTSISSNTGPPLPVGTGIKDSLIIMQLLKNNLAMWTEST